MRSEQETTRLLREWLGETLAAVPPPERTVADVLRRLPETAQRDPLPSTSATSGGMAGQPAPATGAWLGLPAGVKVAIAAVAVSGSVAAGFLLRDTLPSVMETAGPSPTALPTGARTLMVDPADPGAFETITGAVAQARDGDTVLVRPGTYTERVVVSARITIAGDGPADTIIVRATDAAADPFASTDTQPERNAFVLDHSSATLRDLRIGGPDVATAIAIHGGSPLLERLIVDLDGEQDGADPALPHESMAIDGGSHATIRDSTFDGFIDVQGGSPITFTGNEVHGGCLYLHGPGSDATVRESWFVDSACPAFAIGVREGAKPILDGNTVEGSFLHGIEVTGEGSDAIMRTNTILRTATGIWVSGGASPVVEGNVLRANETAIALSGALVVVRDNDVDDNRVGIRLTSGVGADVAGNQIRDNEVGVRLDGAASGVTFRGDVWCGNGQDIDVVSGPAPTVADALGCEALLPPSDAP